MACEGRKPSALLFHPPQFLCTSRGKARSKSSWVFREELLELAGLSEGGSVQRAVCGLVSEYLRLREVELPGAAPLLSRPTTYWQLELHLQGW